MVHTNQILYRPCRKASASTYQNAHGRGSSAKGLENRKNLFGIPNQPVPKPAHQGTPPSAVERRTRLSTLNPRCNNSRRDRKSTRLNSSHITISYAVFCL